MLGIKDLPVQDGIRFLYQHLLDNYQIREIENPNQDHLHIIPYKVFEDLTSGRDGEWESCMPAHLVDIIKTQKCFGYGRDQDPFEYDKSDGQDAEYY